MNIEVVEEKQNPLLKRKELIVSIDYDGVGTPSKAILQTELSKNLGVNQELIEVTKIFSETGLPQGKAWVKIWETKPLERKKKVEATKEEPVKTEAKTEKKPQEKLEDKKEAKKED